MAETKLSIKVLIDTVGKRVLFAEAGKDCVDFLFFILSLPLSAVIRLLEKQQMVGSLPNLYESIETLNESYLLPNITKETLLQPAAPLPGYSVPLLSIKGTAPAPQHNNFYRCSNLETRPQSSNCPNCRPRFGFGSVDGRNNTCCEGYGYVSDDPRAICPKCSRAMNTAVTYVAAPGAVKQPSSGGSGFVKEVVTYMVMDDLVVKPMSTISSITLLAQFNIKDLAALEEKVLTFGMNEAVKLLKASLVSKKVLTTVFLNHGDNA